MLLLCIVSIPSLSLFFSPSSSLLSFSPFFLPLLLSPICFPLSRFLIPSFLLYLPLSHPLTLPFIFYLTFLHSFLYLFSPSLMSHIPLIHPALRRQIFKEHLHTRVVLVAAEIWTDKDQIPISVKPLEMLRDFSKYRQQSIKHHADAVHLFS